MVLDRAGWIDLPAHTLLKKKITYNTEAVECKFNGTGLHAIEEWSRVQSSSVEILC